MARIDFALGFLASWIITTKEGKETANKVANTAYEVIKKYTEKKQEEKETKS